MSNFNKVLKECLKAYADCHSETPKAERNLSFKATHPLTGEQFVRVMNRVVPDGYNEFDSVVAENVRSAFGENAEYYIAREGSVCVYIKGSKVTGIPRNSKLAGIKNDEVSEDKDGTIRVWWD